MANAVVVAIPPEDDYVWKISSEEVPHMTLLFLGPVAQVKNLSKIADYIDHAAKTALRRFGLEVDRRGTLGPDEADVLFFSQSRWSGIEQIKDFRSYLLQEPNIRTAFDSQTQFPEWQPHLTLGYPTAPAKKDERDYPGFYYVNFDRIALWINDFDGFEYPLKSYEYDWDMEVAMSSTSDAGADAVATLFHHGVKGMRWGIRRKNIGTSSEVVVKDTGRKLKTSGGEGHPAHADAVKARSAGQKGRASGLKALSNEELSQYANRLQLEQRVKGLEFNEKPAVKKFVAGLLGSTAKAQAQSLANEAASKQVKKTLAKTVVKTATVAAVA